LPHLSYNCLLSYLNTLHISTTYVASLPYSGKVFATAHALCGFIFGWIILNNWNSSSLTSLSRQIFSSVVRFVNHHCFYKLSFHNMWLNLINAILLIFLVEKLNSTIIIRRRRHTFRKLSSLIITITTTCILSGSYITKRTRYDINPAIHKTKILLCTDLYKCIVFFFFWYTVYNTIDLQWLHTDL